MNPRILLTIAALAALTGCNDAKKNAALDDERQRLDAERAELEKDKARLAAEKELAENKAAAAAEGARLTAERAKLEVEKEKLAAEIAKLAADKSAKGLWTRPGRHGTGLSSCTARQRFWWMD